MTMGKGFFWGISVTCQYHSTNAPLSTVSIIPPMLHSLLSVSFHQCSTLSRQYHCTNALFSPVSIIPPMLHSLMSVSFHQRSTLLCQYHCTNAPLSLVSIIPPALHSPLSVSLHHYFVPIRVSPMFCCFSNWQLLLQITYTILPALCNFNYYGVRVTGLTTIVCCNNNMNLKMAGIPAETCCWEHCEWIASQILKYILLVVYIPYILESNPRPFCSFRGLKNQMRITIACGLDLRSRAGFWKNDRAAVRAVITIQ
jgi:hypothetical protein